MKMHVMSDLHTEFWTATQQRDFFARLDALPSAETLILAGDVGNFSTSYAKQTQEILSKFVSRYKSLYFVPGNHDYWGISIQEGVAKFESLMKSWGPSVKILYDPQAADIISGCTGWFGAQDFRWIDFRKVKSSQHILVENEKLKAWIRTNKMPPVMVTHHYPTMESCHPRWGGSESNQFFCAGLESVLQQSPGLPKLWIHGHTHDPMDFVSGFGFRVYCNPMGYSNEGANPGFWDRVCLDF